MSGSDQLERSPSAQLFTSMSNLRIDKQDCIETSDDKYHKMMKTQYSSMTRIPQLPSYA